MISPFQKRLWIGLGLLVIVAAVGIFSWPETPYQGDPVAYREEARALLLGRGLSVEPSIAENFGEYGQYFAWNEKDQRWVSKYGVMNSLLNMIPLALERKFTGELPALTSETRLNFLNGFFLAVTLLCALYLYRLGLFFMAPPLLSAAFVLVVFYSSFLWNYLRAHNSESTQILFFLIFLFHALHFHRSFENQKVGSPWSRTDWRHFNEAWLAILVLVLIKLSFALLIPLWALTLCFLAYRRGDFSEPKQIFVLSLKALIPGTVIVLILGWVNWVKFGSPFLPGYHQWRWQDHTLSGNIFEGLRGFLWSEQHGLWSHAPFLILGVWGFPLFFRKSKASAVLLGLVFFTYLITTSLMPSWRGGWCYGPRYLSFLVPFLALPGLVLVNSWKEQGVFQRLSGRFGAGFAALVLGFSFFLQVQVNRLDFFAYYQLAPPFQKVQGAQTHQFFLKHHYGWINFVYLHHQGEIEKLPFYAELVKDLKPEELQSYQEQVAAVLNPESQRDVAAEEEGP